MEQNQGSFIDFLKNFDFQLHHIGNNSELIEPKDRNIVYCGFIISLIEQIYLII